MQHAAYLLPARSSSLQEQAHASHASQPQAVVLLYDYYAMTSSVLLITRNVDRSSVARDCVGFEPSHVLQ